MKTRLPKALLLAVLASSAAFAIERPCYVNPGLTNGDITDEIISYQGKISEDDDKAKKALSYVKDGGSTATITGDIVMDTRLIVREGTLIVQDATITQSSYSEYDYLVIGGKKVNNQTTTLKLDNAHIIQTDKGGYSGFMKVATVGNKDGAGILWLTGGSTLKTGQLLHAGYPSYSNAANGSYATADPNDNTTYFETNTPGRGTIIVDNGSKIYAGSGYMVCHSDMLIDGKGSEILSATRNFTPIHGQQGLFSFLGDMDDCTSTVTITNGGAMKHYNHLIMSGSKATTKVSVDGSEDGVKSLFASYNIVEAATKSEGAVVDIDATGGGIIHMADATLGAANKNNTVTVDIDGESSYTGSRLIVNDGTTFTNKGTVKLTDATIVTQWRDDGNCSIEEAPVRPHKDTPTLTADVSSELVINGGKFINEGSLSVKSFTLNGGELTNSGTIAGDIFMDGGVFTMEKRAVAAGLTATSGVINISGNVTFKGLVQLGTVAEATALMLTGADSPALTVYIKQGSVITLDTTSLTVDGQTFTVGEDTVFIVDLGNEVFTADTQLFTLAGANAELLASATEAIAAKTTVTWTVGEDKQSVGFGTDTTLSDKNIGTTVVAVPEPTTATLSLLALCGLAMRRRRK